MMTLDEFIECWKTENDGHHHLFSNLEIDEWMTRLITAYEKRGAVINKLWDLWNDNPLNYVGGPGEFKPVLENDDD